VTGITKTRVKVTSDLHVHIACLAGATAGISDSCRSGGSHNPCRCRLWI